MSESSSSASSCQIALDDEIQAYYLMVGVSLTLTFMVVLVYHWFLKTMLEGAPNLAAQFYYIVGIIKIIIAAIIYFIFTPTCPNLCICTPNIPPKQIYPIFALLVGISWIRKTCTYHRMARELTRTEGNTGGDPDGAIFNKVSTVEMA